MAVTLSLQRGLDLVRTSKNPDTVEECFKILRDALKNRYDADRPGIDIIVKCAEAALHAERIDIARQALTLYDAEAALLLAAGREGEKLEIADQFRVRAKYARGVVEAFEARTSKGSELIESTLHAISIILDGMEIAEKNPRHRFLVYNGSVHFWHASWVLQRAGMRKHVVEPTQRVVRFLQAVPGLDQWRARLQIALSRGLAEIGRTDEALKGLAEAKSLAQAAGDMDLQKEAVTVSTHLAFLSGKGKVEGSTPSEQALSMAQEVRTVATLTRAQVEDKLRAAYDLVDPDPDAAPTSVDLSVVAVIAWTCACKGVLDLGEEAAKRALVSKDLRVRARAELSICQLELDRVQAQHGDDLVPANVRARESILNGAEQCCAQFLRLLDPSGVQDAAVLIWNAALPLLQKNLREKLKRIFFTAANALSAIQSPMTRLRTQFHLEIAKLDVEEDSMVKAADQVAAALSLDYAAATEEQRRTDLERPLDRYLEPMYKALQLKTAIYEEPDNIEDQVIVLVERAKDVKGQSARQETLERAISLFMDLPPISPPYAPSADGQETVEELQAQRRLARNRNALWMEIIRVGWASRLHDVVLHAAPFALAPLYDPKVDFEMVRMQAEICYIEAEAGILSLRVKGKTLTAPGVAGYPDDRNVGEHGFDETGLPLRQAPVDPSDIQLRVPSAIVQGMRFGLSINEPWLVTNGAVLAWNHYTHVFVAKDLKDMLPFVGDVFDIVMQLDRVDPELLCNLGNITASALEHKALYDHYGGDDSLSYKALVLAAVRDKVRLEGDEDITRAATACRDVMMKLGDADPLRAFMETHARTIALAGQSAGGAASGGAGGGKGDKKGDKKGADKDTGMPNLSEMSLKELAALVVAGINNVTEPSLSDADKAAALGNAASALAKMEEKSGGKQDVEMWTKLGQAALLAGMPSESVQCCKHAMSVLPSHVKVDEIDMPEDATSEGAQMDDRLWYWLSMCQNIMSQAVLGLIEPSQDAIMQARLKRMSIRHAVASAKFGNFCKRKDLVNAAARLLWNASVDFMNMVITRKTLVSPFGDVASILAERGIEDPEFGVRYFVSLADLVVEGGRYADGLLYMEEALRCLPQSMHMPLLEYKVLFASKLGRDVEAEMLRVANFTPTAQAKVWLVLATESISEKAQLEGRQKAVDVLKGEPWSQAEYLVELAEFVLHTERNQQLARDMLLEAASLLLRSDHTRLLGEIHTLDLFSSHDPLEDLAKPARTGVPVKTKHASATTERVLLCSNGWKFVTPKNVRTAALRVEHLEGMLRAMTLLASIRRLYSLRVICASAAAIAAKIIVKMVSDQVNATHWRIPTLEEQDAEEERRAIAEGRPTLTKSNTFRRQRQEVIPAVGPNGEEPLLQWFYNPLEWHKWQCPEEAVPMLKDETRSKYPRMASVALKQPEQTVHYLKNLIEQLDDLGLPTIALPCTVLLHMAATQGLRGQNAANAAFLYQTRLFDRMGMGKEAEKCLDKAGDLSKAEVEEQECENDLAQMEMSDALARAQKSSKLAGDLGFGRVSPTLEKQKKEADKQKTLAKQLSRQDSGVFLDKGVATINMEELRRKLQQAASVYEMRPMTIHDIWILRVWFLVERAQYGPAREILIEAHKHAEALEDNAALGLTCAWQARMEVLANNRELAIQYARQAMEHGGDLRMWRQLLVTAAQALTLRSREQRGESALGQDCIDFIDKCVTVFSHLRQERAELEWEVGCILADLMKAKAQVMWERIIAGREGMKPLDCSMHFNAGMQALQTAVHIFRPMGLSPMLAQCLTEFAQFVVSGARVPGRKVNEDGRPRLRQAQASLREAEKYAGILENWIKETVGWRPSDHEEDLEEGDGSEEEPATEGAKEGASKKSKAELEAEAEARAAALAEREQEQASYALAAYPVTRVLAECRSLLAMTEYEIGNISKLYADKDKRRARPRFPQNPRAQQESLEADAVADWLDATAGHDWDAGLKNFQSAVQWADQAFSATMCHVPAAVARAKYAKGATLLALHVREQEQIRAQEQEASAESSRAAVDAEASRAGPAPAEAKAEAGAKPQQAAGSGAAAPKGPLKAGSVRDKGKGAPPPEPPVEEGPPPEPTLEDQGMRLLQEALDLAVDSMEYWTAMRVCEALANHRNGAGQSRGAVEAVLMAQAIKASEELVSVYRDASALQALERLKTRQRTALKEAVVALSDSRHYNAVDQDLKTVSLMSDLLNPKCPMDAALNMVPTTTDILCLYLGQDDATMYVAVRITETPQASTTDVNADNAPRIAWHLRTVRVDVAAIKDLVVGYNAFKRAADMIFVTARNLKRVDAGDPVLVSLNQRWEDVRAQFTAQLDPILGVVADVADWRSRSLLLLPDILLSRLPLESLGVFAQADSLGRDFSLALLHHRLSHVKERPREEKLSATDKGGEKKEGGEMKGGKAAAPEEPGASFQVASMSYLVDLRAEDDPSALPGRRTGKLAEEFKGLLKSVGAGWRGVVGDGDKVAGEDECIALFESSRAMIYMGMGRFGAFVSPKAVAAADLRGCRLSLILDGIMNEELDRRQSSVDLRKAAWELSSEGAFEMACILSLRGVTTVVVNLAASHPDANMHVAKCLESLKQAKVPDVGRAIRSALKTLPIESDYSRSNTIIYGCPFLAPK